MVTIWDLLGRRLMPEHAGTGAGALSAHLIVTGAWASSRALRAAIRSLRSLLLSFSKVQEAVRVAATGGATIARVYAPYAGGLLWSRQKGGSIAGSGATAPKKGRAPSPRRGTAPLTVILSLSAAVGVAKAAGAYSGAISKHMPPAFAPHQGETSVIPTAVEGEGSEPREEESGGAYMPAPSARTVIGEESARAAGITMPEKEARKGVGRKVHQIPGLSGVALSSSFMATAAVLGAQAKAALSGAAGSAFRGWAPRALPLEWKAASGALAGTSEPARAPSLPAGVHSPPGTGLPGPLPMGEARGGMASIAEGAATTGTGIRMPAVVELTKKQLPRAPTLTGTTEISGRGMVPPEAGGMAPARYPEAEGAPIGHGLEGFKFQHGTGSGGAAFLPLAAAIGRTEFRKAAGIWKPIFGAVSPALFALSVPTMALGLPGRKRMLPPTAQAVPSRQVADGQVATAGVTSVSPLLGSGLLGQWKRVPLAALNLAAMAEEVRSSIIAPQLAIPHGEEARSGIDGGHEAAAERLPVPAELEEPQVYPMQRELRVNVTVEGDEDLLELQRKISRIIEDEMRRHYGEG
uniref:Uncharacterized protein n=1 Tax=Candidatus Methanosuratincola petrocarbonis (ex Vanwonterghem et al. 2016) TaxID=1867261 RepID=A0A7J3UYZ2_9CREN